MGVTRTRLLRSFGLAVREDRQRVGLSQEELADLAGLHRTYVSLLERGERNPSLEVISRLVVPLKTSMSGLLRRVEGASA